MRTFSGKFDQDGVYAWLNPDLPIDERYNRERLLSDYVETDESTYDYFLGMLPPMYFSGSGFAICEASTQDVRLGFFRINGRHFAAHISDHDPAHKMAAVRDALARETV